MHSRRITQHVNRNIWCLAGPSQQSWWTHVNSRPAIPWCLLSAYVVGTFKNLVSLSSSQHSLFLNQNIIHQNPLQLETAKALFLFSAPCRHLPSRGSSSGSSCAHVLVHLRGDFLSQTFGPPLDQVPSIRKQRIALLSCGNHWSLAFVKTSHVAFDGPMHVRLCLRQEFNVKLVLLDNVSWCVIANQVFRMAPIPNFRKNQPQSWWEACDDRRLRLRLRMKKS
jgi:hypothetical protein